MSAAPLLASDGIYLQPGRPDGIELLPPPPPPNSPEQKADLDTVRSVFEGRSAKDKSAAENEGDFDVFAFQAAIGPFFQKDKLPRTEAFFSQVDAEIEPLVKHLKNHYKRPRPCDSDPKLLDGPVARSFGYPSRHSTTATVYALILDEIFPDKTPAFSAIGRKLGWLRVVMGRHYPSDIFAGRVLGRAIFHEMWKNPKFQQDFAGVKAELLAAQAAGK